MSFTQSPSLSNNPRFLRTFTVHTIYSYIVHSTKSLGGVYFKCKLIVHHSFSQQAYCLIQLFHDDTQPKKVREKPNTRGWDGAKHTV